MRKFRVALALIIAISCSAALAAQKPIQKLLPASGFKGWSIVADSYAYGKELGLTEIYDGGYKEYLDAGVIEAAKQMYQRKKVFADVTVHRMKSEASAKAFYAKQLKAAGKDAKAISRPWTGFTWTTGGSVYGHLSYGDYYVTTTLTSKDAAGAVALMQEVGGKIKGVKPSNKTR